MKCASLRAVFVSTTFLIGTALLHAEESKAPEKKDPADDKGKAEKDNRKVVRLTTAGLRMAELELQIAKPGTIARSVDAPGEIALNGDAFVHVTPRMAGVAIKVLKVAGDKVKAGDVLAIVESTELGNGKLEYFSTKTTAEFSKSDLEREQSIYDGTEKLLAAVKNDPTPDDLETSVAQLPLGDIKTKILSAARTLRLAEASLQRAEKGRKDNLVSATVFDAAVKDVGAARAEYKGAIEELRLSSKQRLLQSQRAVRVSDAAVATAERRLYLLGLTADQIKTVTAEAPDQIARYEIKAPISGMILEKQVTQGEHVEQTKELFTIVDLATVWVNLRVYTTNLEQVRAGQSVRITVPQSDKPLTGKITIISPLIDERTRSATARVILDNAAGSLMPGMFVSASIIQEEVKAELAVPVEALHTIDGKSVVFVNEDKEKDGEFFATPVLVGLADDLFVQIKSGLKPGATIAVHNSFTLKAELGKGSGDE